MPRQAAAKPSKAPAQSAPARHYKTPAELRVEAKAIRDAHGYSGLSGEDGASPQYRDMHLSPVGRLTPVILADLEPLLNEPIDPRYIKTLAPQKGKPYESTGIRSVQVQVNRLNAVLGIAHWRKLLHYEDGGTVCHAHLLIGNNLAGCKLDEGGELVLGDHAEVLAHEHGWGGHQQGSTRGDIRKGAETNSMKRTIAQAGPGQDVYCLDFDEDNNPSDREPPPAANSARSGATAPEPTDAVTGLAAILGQEDDLTARRKEADEGMRLFGLSPDDRLERLKTNDTDEKLTELIARISIALDERETLA